MRKITGSIGQSKTSYLTRQNGKADIKTVLICRPNHRLGNLLLMTPLVQEIKSTFPNCKIDLFVQGNLASIIYQNYEYVDTIIKTPRKPFDQLRQYLRGWIKLKEKKYDLAINLEKGSSSGRLSTQFANSEFKFFGNPEGDSAQQYSDHENNGKAPVYNFRSYLSKSGVAHDTGPVPLLDLKLDAEEIANGKNILDALTNNDKPTICIFTYATGSKCYPESWWMPLYKRLTSEFQAFNIIEVLPVENVSQINFTALTFYSRDIREIGAVIANAVVFVGADSGIMHLASSAQTPTIGLFGITMPEKYAPYGNKSIGLRTDHNYIEDCVAAVHAVVDPV